MKPRVVFDCMVFLQGAARATSPARACFHLIDDGRATLFVSAEILAEVRGVLARPKIQRKFPMLSPEWAETFVKNVELQAVAVANVPKWMTLERDPKDEPYLNLAIRVNANYLVTRDLDLLDLMKNSDFRQQYSVLRIVEPVAFLQEIDRLEQST